MNTLEEAKKIIERRHEISTEYCKSKGWTTDFTKLDFEQIMEIRSLDSWKNPLINNDTQADA